MKAVDIIMEEYAERLTELTALARSIVADASEAEDVMQDVMVGILESPEKLDGVKNPRAFLRTCVRNEAIDHVRALSRTAPTPDELLSDIRTNVPEDEYKEIEALMWIRSYIESLPAEMREAFVRYAVDGHKIADIAKDMGIPASTLRKRFDLVKKRMRGDIELFTMMLIILR